MRAPGQRTPQPKMAQQVHLDRYPEDREDSRGDHGYENQSKTKLMIAAGKGELRSVRQFIKTGVNVNARSKKTLWECERTALTYAAENGRTEVVLHLLAAGADVKAKDGACEATPGGRTALHYAARGGHIGTIRALLAAGAGTDTAAKDGATPLIFASEAAHVKAVRLLLQQGAVINARDRRRGTALLAAVSALGAITKKVVNNRLVKRRMIPLARVKRTVHTLLSAGADANVVDKDYGTPLMSAVSDGNLSIVRLLINAGADVNLQDRFGDSPLARAVTRPGRTKLVKRLLECGADPRLKDCDGMTVVEVARRSYLKHGQEMRHICQMLEQALPRPRRLRSK
jgi:ankyrin repeat protein